MKISTVLKPLILTVALAVAGVAGAAIVGAVGEYSSALSLAAVSEPESSAMFLAGLGIMLAMVRKNS